MQGGFSIREYASRMRSINVVNCWPFDETFSEETVKSLLPPITVKKFTWWLDELEYIHSESVKNLSSKSAKKKKKKPEKGETSMKNEDQNMNESDTDVEEGLGVGKVKSLKGKMKTQKKRSIVEIFAVAPPIEPVISEEEEEEEEEEEDIFQDESLNSNFSHVEINCSFKGKSKKKKKMKEKNRDVILRKALRVVKKIKKKSKKQEDEMGHQSIADKEHCFKLKLQAQDKATENPSPSYSQEVENDSHYCVSTIKRKPRLQHLVANNKSVSCKAFKLIEENQHPGLPARGILKSHGKASSLKQSTKRIFQEGVQVNHSSAKKANKHVTFIEKEEILRLSGISTPLEECLELYKLYGADIGNLDRAGGEGKDSTVPETSGSEDASIQIGKEVGAGRASNKQLSTYIVDSTTSTKQNSEGKYSGRLEASERCSLHNMNQYWSDSGLDDPHESMDACPPRFFHMPLDWHHNRPNMIELITNSSDPTCRRLDKDLGAPCSIFPPPQVKDCLRTYNEASVSHLSHMEKRTYKLPQASSESTAMSNGHSFQFQTFPQVSPNELLNTFCSLPDKSLTRNICGRSINDKDEDYVGLPLNSQGEFITFNLSAKNQVMNSNAGAAHSISSSLPSIAVSKRLGHPSECRGLDCRTSSTDHLNLFPVESYVKENPIAVIPSRLGITESQSESNKNLNLDFLQINYHSFHDSENMCKGDNQVLKSPGNEKRHSTMRLMGKEFEVSGRGVHGLEDGHIWKDKQIIDELHFENNLVSNMVHAQNEPSLGKSRESLFCPSEITINHRSKSKCALPHFDHQTSSIYQSVYVARKSDPAQKLYPSLPPGTFSEVYKSESLFSEPFTSGYESRLFNLELPTPTAAYHELYPNMSPSGVQLKNKQNLHHTPISAIKFPFMHPDLDGRAKSSWSGSSVSQPPLCFDAPEMATQLRNSRTCNPGCNHSYLNAGSSHGTDSLASRKPRDICMFSPLSSGSALQMPVAPTSLSPTPYYPGILPVSSMQKRQGNQKHFKERIKSRIGIRGLDIGKKSKAQRSALSTVPFKPFKMPTFGFHENIQCAIRKPTPRVTFEDSVKNMEDVFESHSATNKSKFVMCGVDSDICTARTGPIKLTAGGKHILKACQQKDQSSSRSTDQEISLSTTTIDFRFSESENSAKIYKFSGKAPIFKL